MDNHFLSYFDNVVMIKVTGKNINHFLATIYKLKINLLEVKLLSQKEVRLILGEKELKKLLKLKTVNKIEVIKSYGKLRIKQLFFQNRLLLFTLVGGYFFLLILARLIFSIDIIHDNKEIRKLINEELKSNNLEKFKFKPSYKKLDKIKKGILNNHRDKIEWLEIIEVGTKYIIRVEERKIIKSKEEVIFQDIIAAKEGIIIKIEADKGMIVKKNNDYVKKGDIIISGKITNNDNLANMVKANGKVLAEVWYNVRVELPLVRKEIKETNNIKDVYQFQILSFKLPLFDFNPFKDKKVTSKVIASHPLLPIKLIKAHQQELYITDYLYTESEALIKATDIAIKKMTDKLKRDDYLISYQLLKYYLEDKKIFLDVFFKVGENIGIPQTLSFFESE